MLLALGPHPALAPFVSGYWLVRDWGGTQAGQPISTSPFPGAVLTVSIGRPNAMVGGSVIPRVSLLGIQTARREWRSGPETYFVMAILTLAGLARLFPAQGGGLKDRLADTGELLGDRATSGLAAVGASWQPRRIQAGLDAWLLARLEAVPTPPLLGATMQAYCALRSGASVQAAASTAGVSPRQLHRWFLGQVGLGPQQLLGLDRLQASLSERQRGLDGMAGYSDQSHQIRQWRRTLGLTPGQYAKQTRSPMALSFNPPRRDDTGVAFYL